MNPSYKLRFWSITLCNGPTRVWNHTNSLSHFFHGLNQCREQQLYLKSLYSKTVNICKLCSYMPCKTSYLELCTTVLHTASRGGREVFLSLFYRKLWCGTGRAELGSALIESPGINWCKEHCHLLPSRWGPAWCLGPWVSSQAGRHNCRFPLCRSER